MKKLDFTAIAKKTVAAAGGGALYAFGEQYVPIENNYGRIALISAVGAMLPELNPKEKMLADAGSGIIGAAVSDLTRIVMNSNRDTTTKLDANGDPIKGLGYVEPIYRIDEEGLAGLEKTESSLA
jgi:hypothetical protein